MRAERITLPVTTASLPKPKPKTSSNKLKSSEIVIIDSIQTLHTDYRIDRRKYIPNSETTAELIKFAKETNIPYSYWPYYQRRNIAGPKYWNIWLTPFYSLKATEITCTAFCVKNRFGSTAEIGIYEMLGSGLREVSNPSEILISHKDEEQGLPSPLP
jgi:DNA repair protein RadA/Sms